MSHVALYHGKSSVQEDVLFNPDGAEMAARMLKHIGEQKKRAGKDPTADYAQFLSMYHLPLLRDYKPGVLAAPGVITIDQQGGTATYGANLTFRHTQAGDFSRFSQLNFVLSDVSTSAVTYSGIQQFLSDVAIATDYSVFLATTVANPEADPGADVVASQFQGVISTIEITPCRPSGQLIKLGDSVQNFVAFADYPGEAMVSAVNIMVGTNEYIKYNKTYQVMRRNLLEENKRLIYDELVGQERKEDGFSEEAAVVSGLPNVFAAANNVEFLSAANKTAAENAVNSLSANTRTVLDTYGMRAQAAPTYTAYEHKSFCCGLQTPKASHTSVRFSVPVWTHPSVDSDNGLSNMTFASFIRVYTVTLAAKAELMKLRPGNGALRYKSSIVFQQVRSHIGYDDAIGTNVGSDASAANANHVRLLHQNVLSETEAILPASITGSAISGGDISSLNITSGQVYLLQNIRPIIENQASVCIYHLPDMHDYALPTSNASFSVNSNDGRWVSKALYVLPYPAWNRSTSNPFCHKTWHEGAFADVTKVPKDCVMDVPQNQVDHLSSMFDVLPIISTAATPTGPNPLAASVTAIRGVLDSNYDDAVTQTHIRNRYLYQSPVRKQSICGWSNLILKRSFVTKLGLRVQSFPIYDADFPHVITRASFFYSNQGISPRDKHFFILPLSLKPLDESTNSGGLNLSKYRDVIFDGEIDTTVIAALNTVSSDTSATLAICSYSYNVLVTTQRTQFRRFAN